MNLGFIGMGFVGGNTAKVFEEKFNILAYDKYKSPYTSEENISKIVQEAEIIFLSVPTPMKKEGGIDLSIIYESLDLLKKYLEKSSRVPLVVIRSTAVPGTTEKLEEKYNFNFAYNPEFLREKTAYEDMKNTSRVVIGAKKKEIFDRVKEVYSFIFPNAKYVFTNTKTAEMIKYAANVFLASQISIANEMYHICKALDVNYNEVKETILLDERIARNINVPGPDGSFGFGGKCFPKDFNALIHLSEEKGYDPLLLKEAWKLNERIRREKDWKDIPGATSENKIFEKKV